MKLGNSLKKSSDTFGNYLYQRKLSIKSMATGSNFVVLMPGVEIKKVKEIVPGIEVIITNNGRERNPYYAVGFSEERIFKVDKIVSNYPFGHQLHNKSYSAIISDENSLETLQESIENLLALDDYTSYLKEKGRSITPTPQYQENQVLYVKPQPHITPCLEYPSVGSVFETDVKVLGVTISKLGSNISYSVYIPTYGYHSFHESMLIKSSERPKYLFKDFKEAVIDYDASPFFKKEETVKIFDGWVYNQEETVIVQLNPQLEKHLI